MRLFKKATRYVNRSAMIVRPREPYLRWLAEGDPSASDALIEVVRQIATGYLVPVVELEITDEVILGKYWRRVFEQELAGHLLDRDAWPAELSQEMFDEWFDVTIVETVVDLDPHRPTSD